MPSTPALLEITVRFLTPASRMASDRVSAMPQRPKPPDMIIMPSLRMPSRADLASGQTLFMKCDLIEESADRGPRGDGLRKPGLAGIIRRNLRNASMQCVNGRCLQPKSVFQNM